MQLSNALKEQNERQPFKNKSNHINFFVEQKSLSNTTAFNKKRQ